MISNLPYKPPQPLYDFTAEPDARSIGERLDALQTAVDNHGKALLALYQPKGDSQ